MILPGLRLGQADIMALALRDILRGDPQLHSLTGGRIERTHLPGPSSLVSTPCITVAPWSEQSTFQPSKEDSVSMPMAVTISIEKPSGLPRDDEASIGGLVSLVKRIALDTSGSHANYYLCVPRFGNRRQCDRIDGFTIEDFSQATVPHGFISFAILVNYLVGLHILQREMYAEVSQ